MKLPINGVLKKPRLYIRFTLSIAIFGIFAWIISLLFHPTLQLDTTHRDLLNIILGAFLASFAKVVEFWFKVDDADHPVPSLNDKDWPVGP